MITLVNVYVTMPEFTRTVLHRVDVVGIFIFVSVNTI